MNAVLNYKDEKFFNSDFEITIDVSLDSNNGVFRRYLVGNNPVNYVDPWGLFSSGDAMQGNFLMDIGKDLYEYGWKSGYYECYAKCMVGPFGTFLAIHIGGYFYSGNIGNLSAKFYYYFTDKRFSAWGKYSKVLVPKLASKLAEFFEGGLAAWLAYDAWHCIAECKDCIK